MEPLTVLDLPESAIYELYSYKYSQVRFIKHVPFSPYAPNMEMIMLSLTAEFNERRGEKHMFVFTEDVEKAKLLDSALLPGQEQQYRRVIR
jgi:hypothetical protein